jgi:hypothetical protein
MLHRTFSIMAALTLALGAAPPAFAGAGTIGARAKVLPDRPSRDAREAGETLWRAMDGSEGTPGVTRGGPVLVAGGLSQLSIVSAPGTPAGQRLIIEFVAN